MADAGIDEVVRALENNPLLGGLERDGLAALATHMELVELPVGETVIRQGDRERALYIVIAGRARVSAGEVDLGPVERGEHVGEMSLLDRAPRSATVTAETALRLARLDLTGYARLAADAPALALAFVQALVGGVVERLRGTTATLRDLTEGTRPPRRTRVTVRTAGLTRTARTGTRLDQLLPSIVDGHPVVAALVDRRPHSLLAGASSDATVEPLTTRHWEGRLIYRTSLGLLLLEACHQVAPGVRLQLDHSVGFAQRLRVSGANSQPLHVLAARLQEAMVALTARNVPLIAPGHADGAKTSPARTGFAIACATLSAICANPSSRRTWFSFASQTCDTLPCTAFTYRASSPFTCASHSPRRPSTSSTTAW